MDLPSIVGGQRGFWLTFFFFLVLLFWWIMLQFDCEIRCLVGIEFPSRDERNMAIIRGPWWRLLGILPRFRLRLGVFCNSVSLKIIVRILIAISFLKMIVWILSAISFLKIIIWILRAISFLRIAVLIKGLSKIKCFLWRSTKQGWVEFRTVIIYMLNPWRAWV